MSPPTAQVPVDAAAVDTALARWEAAAGSKDRMRGEALAQLADFDDPRVTKALLIELKHAGSTPFAGNVLEAIGKKARGTALGDLVDYLRQPGLSPALRLAAARATGHQGNRGIDELLELVRADPDRVADEIRKASMVGLAAANEERAWRGLAPFALRGGAPDRLAVLRLLEPARNVAAVNQARLRLLQDPDSGIAAAAWRQLAAEHHPKAVTAFEDLLERIGPSPAAAVRVELILGLGNGLGPGAYASFLRLAADPAAAVQGAISAVAAALAADVPFVQWLFAEALDSTNVLERKVALAIVNKASPVSLQPLVARVRASLERPTKEALEFALALQGLLAKDPHWPDDVRRMLASADAAVRATAFTLLAELGCGDAVAEAQRSLQAREWEIRAAALRYLSVFRELSSIPLLIARVEKEEGRLAADLADVLFVHTGVRCWRRAEWESWWKKHQDGHVLPALETVRATGGRGGGSTVAYYGIPLASRRTTFLIDLSGSMRERIGTDRKRTRFDEARRQLQEVIAQLPPDQKFNVAAYAGDVRPAWGSLRQAKPEDKQFVLDLLGKVAPGQGIQGTNIHDALEFAFQDPEVDTIYLLTDGQPTVGRLVDPDAIADQVRRWNYGRQVQVHGIAIGDDSALLRRLAIESGGQYVFVR